MIFTYSSTYCDGTPRTKNRPVTVIIGSVQITPVTLYLYLRNSNHCREPSGGHSVASAISTEMFLYILSRQFTFSSSNPRPQLWLQLPPTVVSPMGYRSLVNGSCLRTTASKAIISLSLSLSGFLSIPFNRNNQGPIAKN